MKSAKEEVFRRVRSIYFLLFFLGLTSSWGFYFYALDFSGKSGLLYIFQLSLLSFWLFSVIRLFSWIKEALNTRFFNLSVLFPNLLFVSLYCLGDYCIGLFLLEGEATLWTPAVKTFEGFGLILVSIFLAYYLSQMFVERVQDFITKPL